MTVGDRIRSLREHKGLNQKQLAEILEFPTQTYSNYERGLRNPDFETLNKIADFFQVSIDFLLGRSYFQGTEADGPTNLREYLEKGEFMWGDTPLTEGELKKIKTFIQWLIEAKEN